MQDDSEQLCATAGLDCSRPSSASTIEESPEAITVQDERAPLKRKSDEDLGNDQKRRLVAEETESESSEKAIWSLNNELQNKGSHEENGGQGKEICDPSEPDRQVIIMKGNLPKLALPDGWIALNHRSGGIIYLHKTTRVCCWSRPYHIGGGSVRPLSSSLIQINVHITPTLHRCWKYGQMKHDVPLAAIPCLHQKRALTMEKEKTRRTISEDSNSRFNQGGSILNTLNTMSEETDTAEAVPNDSAITKKMSVEKGHERSGLDVIMSLTDSDDVTERNGFTEKNDVTEQSNMTHKDEEIVRNGMMDLMTTIDAIDAINDRYDVNDQSKVTQHLQVSKNSKFSAESRENSDKRAASKQESRVNGSSSASLELIDAGDLSTYLSNIWEFQALTSDQERYAVIAQPQAFDDLELPPSLECQPYPVKCSESKKQTGKDLVLNAGGKTPVAILHEYCQRVLKTKPVYLSSECENADTPFMAEVQIGEIKYGSGIGSSKKLARQIAAESTLEVLLPGVYTKIRDYQISEAELEFFDKVDILDPRLPDFCSKTTLPNPSQILEECLKRNQGICSSPIQFKTVCGQNRSLSFQITCGKHSATGPCKNKRLGKQLASQQILKKLHPHLDKWGALIRIYCDRPSGSIKKYKQDDSTSLGQRDNGSVVNQNIDLLGRLKSEMRKLHSEIKNNKTIESKHHSAEPVFTVDM